MKHSRAVKLIETCLMIISVLILAGCQSSGKDIWNTARKPWQEVMRSNQEDNKKPFAVDNRIDYSKFDAENRRKIIDKRSYRQTELAPQETTLREGVIIEPAITNLVDLPAKDEISIPELGAKGFKDGQGNVIIIYPARNPAPDLKVLLEKFLTDIEVSEFPNQNKLLLKFSTSKLADPEFMKQLGTTIDNLDQPAVMVRIKFRAFYLWLDNTYNREMIMDILKNGIQTFHFNLPSSYDSTQRLDTGINFNPMYNNQGWRDFTFDGSIGFLDSMGDIDNLISVDALTSNTKSFTYLDQLKVPYSNFIVSGTNVIETVAFEDVGPDLTITPFANENGFITLKIEQAKSGELAALLEKTQRPTFKKGNFTTEFTVRDGVPYVGVIAMSDRFHSIDRGIPGVNRIPILKSLTSSMAIEKNRSELIILIEARVMPRDSSVGTITTDNPIKKYHK